ncbi:MAG: SPFH domain-containing protein [Ardenticatenaceae bacterium]|nr:SPFH domain-containing protein [Ardenticatenaceae bacterium]MCB9443845.1 SPFH domain-containing protein [Ardenticatenaceae bacterium]
MSAVAPSRRPASTNNPFNWFSLLPLVMFLLYWLFVRSLERVDWYPMLAAWWQSALPGISLPNFVVAFFELFHPRVLRHLIIPIVGWYLAHRASVSLVQTLYDLPDKENARSLLSRLQTRGTNQVKPLVVSSKTLNEAREKSELLRVGGPGQIAVMAGDVAVTELNGRFHRILGPGRHILDRLEYIRAILDLRQQERTAVAVPLVTLDGIQVTADVNITFRLETGEEMPSKNQPYPYDEEAVRLAAYNETVNADGSLSTWDNAPLNNVKTNLTKIIANYRLDELLHTRQAVDPFQSIRNEVVHQTRPFLFNQGIELLSLHISRLDLPADVSQQYIEYWQTNCETQIRLQQADGEAMALEEVEIARAEAEMTMIQAIVEGVQRARRVSNTNNMHEIIALRLVEALEKMAKQSQQSAVLPMSLLPQIDEMRRLLKAGVVPPPILGDENRKL